MANPHLIHAEILAVDLAACAAKGTATRPGLRVFTWAKQANINPNTTVIDGELSSAKYHRVTEPSQSGATVPVLPT